MALSGLYFYASELLYATNICNTNFDYYQSVMEKAEKDEKIREKIIEIEEFKKTKSLLNEIFDKISECKEYEKFSNEVRHNISDIPMFCIRTEELSEYYFIKNKTEDQIKKFLDKIANDLKKINKILLEIEDLWMSLFTKHPDLIEIE